MYFSYLLLLFVTFLSLFFFFFFFNDTATTEIYTLSLHDALPIMSCVPPRGAFYAFPRIDVPEEDATWVKELLLEKHILTVQGSCFGQKPGTKHFRIVFLPQEETLKQAYSQIRDFMSKRS